MPFHHVVRLTSTPSHPRHALITPRPHGTPPIHAQAARYTRYALFLEKRWPGYPGPPGPVTGGGEGLSILQDLRERLVEKKPLFTNRQWVEMF